MLEQLETQFLRADLAQARQLLAESRLHDDPMGEHQYLQRVARLERELAESMQAVAAAPAAVALFFGGRPVVGSHGIKAEGASLRVVEGERDFELTAQAIQRARQRAEGLSIRDRVETFEGELIGWAEYSLRFDLRLHGDRNVATGGVSSAAMDRLVLEGTNPLHTHVRALVKVREVSPRNRAPRRTYTLQSIEPIQAPPDWPVRAAQTPL